MNQRPENRRIRRNSFGLKNYSERDRGTHRVSNLCLTPNCNHYAKQHEVYCKRCLRERSV